jgi:hypothetical protein
MIRALCLSLVAASATGCVRVRPYQREFLSQRVMVPDAERVEDRFRAHWGESREGSAGGNGVSGGGCGCN